MPIGLMPKDWKYFPYTGLTQALGDEFISKGDVV